jgi:hypothetical protein
MSDHAIIPGDERGNVVQQLNDYLRATWPAEFSEVARVPVLLMTSEPMVTKLEAHVDVWVSGEFNPRMLAGLLHQVANRLEAGHHG